MKETKRQVRNKWLHIRLNETEYKTISSHYQKTTCKELSDYARRVLLRKPVTVNHRNQSADEILTEMIRLKNELNAIGNNFNQAVHKLHTLDTTPEVKLWVLMCESQRATLLKKTEEIKVRMNEIYEQWLQK
ncbi:MAG: plasmid mobilization relaxosome protein MobC [Sphingobacteriales bacterium]|nr:MAG: plasmid mobilization relaxosome protein MobC [Sphingobacteriales bacterium]